MSGSLLPLSPCLALLHAGRRQARTPCDAQLALGLWDGVLRWGVFPPAAAAVPKPCSWGRQELQNGVSPHLLGQSLCWQQDIRGFAGWCLSSAEVFSFLSKGWVFGEGQPFSPPGRPREKWSPSRRSQERVLSARGCAGSSAASPHPPGRDAVLLSPRPWTAEGSRGFGPKKPVLLGRGLL